MSRRSEHTAQVRVNRDDQFRLHCIARVDKTTVTRAFERVIREALELRSMDLDTGILLSPTAKAGYFGITS